MAQGRPTHQPHLVTLLLMPADEVCDLPGCCWPQIQSWPFWGRAGVKGSVHLGSPLVGHEPLRLSFSSIKWEEQQKFLVGVLRQYTEIHLVKL